MSDLIEMKEKTTTTMMMVKLKKKKQHERKKNSGENICAIFHLHLHQHIGSCILLINIAPYSLNLSPFTRVHRNIAKIATIFMAFDQQFNHFLLFVSIFLLCSHAHFFLPFFLFLLLCVCVRVCPS